MAYSIEFLKQALRSLKHTITINEAASFISARRVPWRA